MVLVAEPGLVRRFQLSPWKELPAIKLDSSRAIFIRADRKWITDEQFGPRGLMPEGGAWSLESGTRERLPASSDSVWIQLFPRDASNDAMLSGDSQAGIWRIDGTARGVRVKQTGSDAVIAELGIGNWAISRGGAWIAVGQTRLGDFTVRVWPWALDRLLARACEVLPRKSLTADEWSHFELSKYEIGASPERCDARRAK